MEYLIGIIAFAVVAALLYYAGHQAGLLALIVGTPTSPIGKVMSGLTEINGRVVPAQPILHSPLGKRECVYFHIHISERVSSGRSSHWRTRVDEKRGGLFKLDDGTGQAVIDISKATIDFETDNHRSSGFLSDAPPDFEQVLRDHGMSSKGLIFNRDFRCEETIIEPGDELYVLGEPIPSDEGPFFNGSRGEHFFVADKDELTIVNNMRWTVLSLRVLAFVIAAMMTVIYFMDKG